MNLKLLSLGLFSASAISPFFIPAFTPSAMACTAVDIGVQVARERKRGVQENNVTQEIDPNCDGGSVVNRSVQRCRSERCIQRRNSNQRIEAGDRGRRSKIKRPRVKVKVPVQVRIQEPKRPFED
ncbi:hypothetical protein [Mastigocoleus sp. MO_188.B34]|uniref:hypothetical protein n=1 Tax=Mastigocoleus sp. MO_188.B34 TaxID=3036635 RepID=UPI00262DDFC3|nr:hypothetical protein [Mastigocoleus sp. MO_188.B34]MDJ0697020.1 hypothetical protein [Mastigocoleus sp. MO_188.B34]